MLGILYLHINSLYRKKRQSSTKVSMIRYDLLFFKKLISCNVEVDVPKDPISVSILLTYKKAAPHERERPPYYIIIMMDIIRIC